MVNKIAISKKYEIRAPGIIGKEFDFSPRLNMILGHNGTGKSLLLKEIAENCGYHDVGRNGTVKRNTEGVTVDHDGTAVYYYNSSLPSKDSVFELNFFETYAEARSSGEKRIALINNLYKNIRERYPVFRINLNRKMTLVLDEPDVHLGFPAQYYFWKEILPIISKSFQIIVATHSIHAILLSKADSLRNDRIVELSHGYVDECIQWLGAAIDGYNREKKREGR